MHLDWLNFLAGVGIFLWGMSLIESSLAKLASGRLNHYLSSWTNTTVSAVVTGAACTAVVQSSSLVTLIVLALASSKLLNLKQAVGVIFGANLGTTATGWLVAYLGFKFSLGEFAIYFIGISALGRIFFAKNPNQTALYTLFISIGLILFSLDIIKSGTLALSENFDLANLQSQSPLVFLAMGLMLATLLQSSSAVMMMNLSAVHAGLISVENAFAIVVGADIGTTSTAILGSIKGAKAKKQLALAHVCFNLTNAVVAVVLILPFIKTIFTYFNITDALISVVAFHSMINLIGILIYLFAFNYFVNFLSRQFKDTLSPIESRISLIPVDIPPVALEGFRGETVTFINNVSAFNNRFLHTDMANLNDYLTLKKTEGLFINFSQKLVEKTLTKEQTDDLYLLLAGIRDGIYSAKVLKDLLSDLEQVELADNYHDKSMFPTFEFTQKFFEDSRNLFDHSVEINFKSFISTWYEELFHSFKTTEKNLLTAQSSQNISVESISTLLNINKSLYKSCKYYMQALESIDKTFKESNHEN